MFNYSFPACTLCVCVCVHVCVCVYVCVCVRVCVCVCVVCVYVYVCNKKQLCSDSHLRANFPLNITCFCMCDIYCHVSFVKQLALTCFVQQKKDTQNKNFKYFVLKCFLDLLFNSSRLSFVFVTVDKSANWLHTATTCVM